MFRDFLPWISVVTTLFASESEAAPRDALSESGEFNNAAMMSRRQTPTTVCKRWSQQSAIVNGTLYLYGGRATTSSSQTSDTWNNDFLSLDLTKTWSIASPSLVGLSQPEGPPAVANGYLWSSFDSLFLYGGEFSDKPATSPVPFSLWTYDIPSSSWTSSASPTAIPGVNTLQEDTVIQRAAEGAGTSVAGLGRGWYFGGHLDGYTTVGWSQSIPRVYLKSLVEFTFPGMSNSAISSLGDGQIASSSGAWRNVTGGGTQDSPGFPERADGILVFVPMFGDEGILLGLAGGTNATLTQMNVIDIYDIATSTWYKQATTGPTPQFRVNPCAVVVAAADGSSFNVHMFAGQDLLPYGQQTQYNDMWILTIPAFQWIQVDMSGQAVPIGRSGHTCNVWNAQMVVVGGYVGTDLSCESPGVYVFDLSSLQWLSQYSISDQASAQTTGNPQNQQIGQIGDPLALPGSYNYSVPDIIQTAIGGSAAGGATITAPLVSATDGPLATGLQVTTRYAVTTTTATSGTQTNQPTNSGGNGGNNGSSAPTSPVSRPSDSHKNVGAIIAGAFAGLAFLAACYLLFCLYVYRKRLDRWRRWADLAQATQANMEERDAFAYSARRSQLPKGSETSKAEKGKLAVPVQTSTSRSSADFELAGREPAFFGIMLHPRRSLKVVNR